MLFTTEELKEKIKEIKKEISNNEDPLNKLLEIYSNYVQFFEDIDSNWCKVDLINGKIYLPINIKNKKDFYYNIPVSSLNNMNKKKLLFYINFFNKFDGGIREIDIDMLDDNCRIGCTPYSFIVSFYNRPILQEFMDNVISTNTLEFTTHRDLKITLTFKENIDTETLVTMLEQYMYDKHKKILSLNSDLKYYESILEKVSNESCYEKLIRNLTN